MARIDDAQKTLRILATHSEAILEAHLTQGNRIPDTPENDHLLKLLKHNRLILSIGDEDPQLKKVLTQFLGHITESDRRRWASQHIDQIWKELIDLFDQYQDAKKKIAIADQERLEDDIKDMLSGLIEDIRIATDTFTAHINSGFSYVTDLDLRIKENERVIKRAGRLIALFDSFKILDLADHAGNDPFLKRLLLKYLPVTLQDGRQNLTYATNQLRILLVRLREDQRMNKLVGSLEAHYERNPGFEPAIDHLNLEACPQTLNSVAPFHIITAPDIYDASDETVLADLAATARSEPRAPGDTPEEHDTATTISFEAESEHIETPVDDVESTIDALIQYILNGDLQGGSIIATEALAASNFACSTPDWLATLMSGVGSLAAPERATIDVEYVSEPDPLFRDNLYIYDVILRKQDGRSRI